MPQANNRKSGKVGAGLSSKDNTSTQRRGPKGYFQGSRKQFLEENLPAYIACKKGNRQNFWHILFSAWWKQFPWKLDDDQEPPTDDAVEMNILALVNTGEGPKKTVVEKDLTGRLKQWFTNHASAAINGTRRDALSWSPLLQRLHQIRNPRPRLRTAIQQFMRDHPTKVKDAYKVLYGGKNLIGAERMNCQHGVAKTLLYEENLGLVDELEEKARTQHVAEENEWNMALENVSSAADVTQARDSLFDAVYPLLQAIGSYAGCYVTLIAGNAVKDAPADNTFFTAVHWWPGDRSSTKNWTQWDEEGFNSGVAGPFLKYARNINQSLEAGIEEEPLSANQNPQASPTLTLPNDVPAIHNPSPSNNAHPRTQPVTISIRNKVTTRPRPTKSSAVAEGTKKRKHTPKVLHSVRCSESDEASNNSGDGSSSGDSFDALAPKRQRVSHITTRASAQTPGVGGVLDPATPTPITTELSTAKLNTGTSNHDSRITTFAINAPGFQSTDMSKDAMDTDVSPKENAPLSEVGDSTLIENEVSCNTGAKDPVPTDVRDPVTIGPKDHVATNTESPVVPDTKDPAETNADDLAANGAKDPTATDIEDPATVYDGVLTTAARSPSSPLPVSLDDIDEANVPTFLLCHGKGKRQINIFAYLRDVGDPHFQRVLYHYLNFEINNKSGVAVSLPTAKRPIEISQWSSRARPANIPDYMAGGRTFVGFVDSVFTWWASIQPLWRNFKRGQVSRVVNGGWEVLHSPHINGILNVVMLAYWWVKILEEHEPKDGVRADYESFAADVAWVLSNLPN